MKEGLINDVYEAVAKELQLLLSISYLIMIGIGMLFNNQRYSEFGINIFQYADIFDFLIAPFEDWRIISFALTSLLIPLAVVIFDKLWREKSPKSYSIANFKWDKKRWYNTMRTISFGGLFLFFTIQAANDYGEKSKSRILEQKDIRIVFADESVQTGKQIGKTSETLFLFQEECVKAIPLNFLVKEIEL
jgi:magnesium-transporting ATPase (P-type)